MAGAMGDANKFLMESGNINDKMVQILTDQKYIQQQQAETNDMMNQLAQNENQADEDELYKELEKQMNTDKAQKISAQLNTGPQQTVKVPAIVQQQQYQQKSAYPPQQIHQPIVAGKTKQSNHMDDIQRMLNNS